MEHTSVLLNEVLEVIRPQSGGKYFDGKGNGVSRPLDKLFSRKRLVYFAYIIFYFGMGELS